MSQLGSYADFTFYLFMFEVYVGEKCHFYAFFSLSLWKFNFQPLDCLNGKETCSELFLPLRRKEGTGKKKSCKEKENNLPFSRFVKQHKLYIVIDLCTAEHSLLSHKE